MIANRIIIGYGILVGGVNVVDLIKEEYVEIIKQCATYNKQRWPNVQGTNNPATIMR